MGGRTEIGPELEAEVEALVVEDVEEDVLDVVEELDVEELLEVRCTCSLLEATWPNQTCTASIPITIIATKAVEAATLLRF